MDIDVDRLNGDSEHLRGNDQPARSVVANAASPASQKGQAPDSKSHDSSYRPRPMRPVTAFVIAGLLVLIVGAFLWQLYLADGFRRSTGTRRIPDIVTATPACNAYDSSARPPRTATATCP